MVVVVDVPDRDRGGAFGLAGPDPGVEEFLGQGPVVALDLAVVAGGVGAGALVAWGDGSDGARERGGLVVRAVVGDDPYQPVDAVGGEERPGAVEEGDRGGGLLVAQVLGVGQAGVAVDGGVQVDVAGAGPGGLGPRRVARSASDPRPWARHPPPSGMCPTFLTSMW